MFDHTRINTSCEIQHPLLSAFVRVRFSSLFFRFSSLFLGFQVCFGFSSLFWVFKFVFRFSSLILGFQVCQPWLSAMLCVFSTLVHPCYVLVLNRYSDIRMHMRCEI